MKEIKELLKIKRVEELAAELNVAGSSIWRWKSGRKPSRLAEEKILALHNKVIASKKGKA